MAPGMDVNPPRINTGRAFRAIRESENWTPDLDPHMMPATSATTPAMDHTMTHMTAQGDAHGDVPPGDHLPLHATPVLSSVYWLKTG